MRRVLPSLLFLPALAFAGMTISPGTPNHTHNDANTGGASLSGTTISGATLSGTTTNSGTISGGTSSPDTLTPTSTGEAVPTNGGIQRVTNSYIFWIPSAGDLYFKSGATGATGDRWRMAADGTITASNGASLSGVTLSGGTVSAATLSGTTTVTGTITTNSTVTSTKACATEFVRIGPNYCKRSVSSSTDSDTWTNATACTARSPVAVTLPADATAVELQLLFSALSNNAVATRSNTVDFWASTNCLTVWNGAARYSEREAVATAAGTILSQGYQTAVVKLTSANTFHTAQSNAGGSGNAEVTAYWVTGYFD